MYTNRQLPDAHHEVQVLARRHLAQQRRGSEVGAGLRQADRLHVDTCRSNAAVAGPLAQADPSTGCKDAAFAHVLRKLHHAPRHSGKSPPAAPTR